MQQQSGAGWIRVSSNCAFALPMTPDTETDFLVSIQSFKKEKGRGLGKNYKSVSSSQNLVPPPFTRALVIFGFILQFFVLFQIPVGLASLRGYIRCCPRKKRGSFFYIYSECVMSTTCLEITPTQRILFRQLLQQRFHAIISRFPSVFRPALGQPRPL